MKYDEINTSYYNTSIFDWKQFFWIDHLTLLCQTKLIEKRLKKNHHFSYHNQPYYHINNLPSYINNQSSHISSLSKPQLLPQNSSLLQSTKIKYEMISEMVSETDCNIMKFMKQNEASLQLSSSILSFYFSKRNLKSHIFYRNLIFLIHT